MSSTRLTSLDASFLEVESSTAHMHVGWAAVLAPPPGGAPPCFTELRDHVESRLGRAPRYRQKLAGVPLGVSEPMWVDDPDFDVMRHVHRARSSDFHEIADMVMSAPLDHDRPLWELWIADSLEDGRIGVVGKVHHCMVDGIAAVELATLLLDATPEPPAGDVLEEWSPAAEPAGLQLLASGLVDRAREAARLASIPLELARRPRRALDLLGKGASLVRAARHSLAPAPESALNEPISAQRHVASAQRPFEELRSVKARHDASVNDVLLAATAGGVRRLMERRGEPPTSLKAMVPVSVRASDEAGELGNRISFVFVDLPCDEADPVRRLDRVKAEMADRKDGSEPEAAQALLDAVAYAPRTVQRAVSRAAASTRAFNLVVSNIPGPPVPLYMLGCELEEVYPVVPLADGHAVSVGLTTVSGRAFFGVYADRDALPDADDLAVAIAECVDELR
jgi:diacylglycerol O-acyltransferase / wax synthase